MSVQVLGWVLEHSEVSGSDRLVLIALANHADLEGRCFPSMATIAREARVSETTARRSVHRMVDDGLVEVTQGGGRLSSRYRVVMTPELSTPLADRQGSPLADLTPTPVTSARAPLSPARGEPLSNRHRTLGGLEPVTVDGSTFLPGSGLLGARDCESCEGTGWLASEDETVTPCLACNSTT